MSSRILDGTPVALIRLKWAAALHFIDYAIAAALEAPFPDPANPEFLSRLLAGSVKVTLAHGEQRRQDNQDWAIVEVRPAPSSTIVHLSAAIRTI